MTTATPRRKPVSRTHEQYVVDLPDRGCEYAPTCAGCPWRACYWTMPPSERRIFRLAFRTLQTFRAAPDRALVD
jgi:hypothetical protein